MPRFAYSAYADTGRLIKGEIEADSNAAALDLLALRGLTPVSVSEGTRNVPWWARDISFGGNGIRQQELISFFSNFSAMLNARYPLMKALRFCHVQSRNPIMKRSLNAVAEAVADGAQLHVACGRENKVFPEHLVTLIKLGEQSNSLQQVVRSISEMLEQQHELKRELRGTLVYPLILLLMSVLVISLIVFYLVPTLQPVFSSAGAPLPTPLAIMMASREIIVSGWPVLAAAAACLLVLILHSGSRLIQWLRPLLMKLPVLGLHIRQRETLSFCQTMSLMLSSGATLPQALATSRRMGGSVALQDMLEQAEMAVADGGRMSDVLTQSQLLDPMAAALIEAAEETDRLAETFKTIVNDLSARLRATLKQAMQLLTPILTLAIGLTVGAVILSTISAIMDINDIAI